MTKAQIEECKRRTEEILDEESRKCKERLEKVSNEAKEKRRLQKQQRQRSMAPSPERKAKQPTRRGQKLYQQIITKIKTVPKAGMTETEKNALKASDAKFTRIPDHTDFRKLILASARRCMPDSISPADLEVLMGIAVVAAYIYSDDKDRETFRKDLQQFKAPTEWIDWVWFEKDMHDLSGVVSDEELETQIQKRKDQVGQDQLGLGVSSSSKDGTLIPEPSSAATEASPVPIPEYSSTATGGNAVPVSRSRSMTVARSRSKTPPPSPTQEQAETPAQEQAETAEDKEFIAEERAEEEQWRNQ